MGGLRTWFQGARARTVLPLVAIALGPATVEGRAEEEPPNYIEMRGAYSDGAYRYLEYGRGTSSGVVVDFLYFGFPDQNELYAGLGYEFQSERKTTFLPILYAVAGRENGERGLTAGLFIGRTTPRTDVYCFFGHFHPLRGDVPGYTFLDSLDVTWKKGSWGAGLSAGASRTDSTETLEVPATAGTVTQGHPGRPNPDPATTPLYPSAVEGGWTWLAGPVVSRSDPLGTWKIYLRGGTHADARLVRTFAF